ncbi:zinc finger protein CONSTANS-LIKE 9-like [Dorcoceras hygrometricum]|uniref:Zinc finger protein CONSTANS-LIKE 9-like n=1 Tax=Dorcoceras hygrometricum TaxID=472368 RepID=A0A2Z7ANG6_9LAMI|nr:zinc finger protein CONSTANS-LIKE 9-like [Dorcoceras hygrometricum]
MSNIGPNTPRDVRDRPENPRSRKTASQRRLGYVGVNLKNFKIDQNRPNVEYWSKHPSGRPGQARKSKESKNSVATSPRVRRRAVATVPAFGRYSTCVRPLQSLRSAATVPAFGRYSTYVRALQCLRAASTVPACGRYSTPVRLLQYRRPKKKFFFDLIFEKSKSDAIRHKHVLKDPSLGSDTTVGIQWRIRIPFPGGAAEIKNCPEKLDWAVKMRTRPPEIETSICDAKYRVSLSTRSVLGKWVYLVTLAMSLFDLQDVCIAIGSLATLDLPMVVDLIEIYVLKGPYCTLTTNNWFLQVLSVIPRGSWHDVARRFTMIRWANRSDQIVDRSYDEVTLIGMNRMFIRWIGPAPDSLVGRRPLLESLTPTPPCATAAARFVIGLVSITATRLPSWPPPPPRKPHADPAVCHRRRPFRDRTCFDHCDEVIPSVAKSWTGLAYLPQSTEKRRVLETPVGARHKCQRGIQLVVGPQPLWLRNHNFGLAQRIMVKRLATSRHDPLGITDSACKNQLVVVSVQYGPFYTYIPIISTTIGKSRVARDPMAMHTSWRSNSDIASVTSIGYPRMRASGESSTTKHRILHASGPHPIPPPNDSKTKQYNQDLGLIHSTNGNNLESPNEGSSIDHHVTIHLHAQNITMFPTNETWYFTSQMLVSSSGGLILILTAQSTRNEFRMHSDY